MALTKAIIEVDERDVDEARGLPQTIEVQFNPTEYTLDKGAQIAEIAIPGIDSPILQFIRGQTEKLTLDLFFDTTADGMGDDATDVTTLTTPIYQLVKIQPRTHALPRIRFTWGQGLSFRAIVESIKQNFTLFNPRGVPLRATLSVSFREYKTLEDQLAELNLQTSDHTETARRRAGGHAGAHRRPRVRRPGRVAADRQREPTDSRAEAGARHACCAFRRLTASAGRG